MFKKDQKVQIKRPDVPGPLWKGFNERHEGQLGTIVSGPDDADDYRVRLDDRKCYPYWFEWNCLEAV